MNNVVDFQERTVAALANAAVLDFCDWLFDFGPDPNLVTREELWRQYQAWKAGRL